MNVKYKRNSELCFLEIFTEKLFQRFRLECNSNEDLISHELTVE